MKGLLCLLGVFALLVLAAPAATADSVVCEPQGPGMFHPPLYWYDVWAGGDWI